MRNLVIALALWLTAGNVALGQGQRKPVVDLPVPLTEPGIVHFPDDETIPPATLAEMYRTELGDAYKPAMAPQLEPAHQLIEKYFATRSAAGRKRAVQALEATKLPPDVLGPLCRVRSDWPALIGGGVFYVNQKIRAYPTRYFLGVPKTYDRTKSWPLAVTLVSASAFTGDSPPDAKRIVELYTGWIQTELNKHPDCLVLMPLLSLSEQFGPSYAGVRSVMDPVLDAPVHVNVDPARVYIAGISAGAQAAWNLALHYPTYFAAFDPLAGSAPEEWQRVRLMNLRNTLPVVWHDDDDKVLKVGFSKSLVDELRRLKIDFDFNETKGVGHMPTSEIVEAEYQKMRKRVRPLYPRQVYLQSDRPDSAFNRVDWVQIYQPLDPGETKRLFFPRGSGFMEVFKNSASVKAEVAGNLINATCDNVDTLRFYVNEHLINFNEPVTVNINKVQSFKQMLKPGIEEMLRDQLVLGRGWRYYSAVVDISMTTHPPPATLPATRPLQKGRIIVGPG